MNQIELSRARLTSLTPGTTRIAELLLLLLLGNENRLIEFEKQGRFVYPIGDEYDLPPFPADLAGKNFNYYRKLFLFEHPHKYGKLNCTLNGKTAELTFEILRPGSSKFARLKIDYSELDRDDCQQVINEYFEFRKSEFTYLERIFRLIHQWWSGNDIYKRYRIPKPRN